MEFDYEAQQDDELSLTVGDIIVNIRRDDGGWWEGELGGRRGFFPDNFVRVSNPHLPTDPTPPAGEQASGSLKGVCVAEVGGATLNGMRVCHLFAYR